MSSCSSCANGSRCPLWPGSRGITTWTSLKRVKPLKLSLSLAGFSACGDDFSIIGHVIISTVYSQPNETALLSSSFSVRQAFPDEWWNPVLPWSLPEPECAHGLLLDNNRITCGLLIEKCSLSFHCFKRPCLPCCQWLKILRLDKNRITCNYFGCHLSANENSSFCLPSSLPVIVSRTCDFSALIPRERGPMFHKRPWNESFFYRYFSLR